MQKEAVLYLAIPVRLGQPNLAIPSIVETCDRSILMFSQRYLLHGQKALAELPGAKTSLTGAKCKENSDQRSRVLQLMPAPKSATVNGQIGSVWTFGLHLNSGGRYLTVLVKLLGINFTTVFWKMMSVQQRFKHSYNQSGKSPCPASYVVQYTVHSVLRVQLNSPDLFERMESLVSPNCFPQPKVRLGQLRSNCSPQP